MAMTIVRCPNRLHIYHTLYSLFQMNLVCNNNQYLVYISFTKKRNDIVPGRGSYIEMTLFQEGRGRSYVCVLQESIVSSFVNTKYMNIVLINVSIWIVLRKSLK